MLREWFRGSTSEPENTDAAPKKAGRMVVDAENPLESTETVHQRRRDAFEKKLAESVKEDPPSANKLVTYDTLFRKVSDILLQGNNHEVQEGITLNISRNAQNVMIGSKWALVNPQMSNWELNLQMNGFTDMIAASWNTMNRYQLMYQRVSSTGALLVTQFMAQKQQGMCQGTVFGVLQYPLVSGGCTQAQYVKDQSFSLSHTQRIVRGVFVGSNLSVDTSTHASTLSHAVSFTTPKKDSSIIAEITPSKGTWRIGAHSFDWGQNMDAAMELEYKESRSGMTSSFNIGCRRSFIGGANLVASLCGFSTVKVNLDLPFGGQMPGVNQFRMTFNCHYDVHSGALKQGLLFTA